MKILQLFVEQIDYVAIHGHERAEVGSPEWHFHNYASHGENGGYQHCEGGSKNPYKLKHFPATNHVINKEFARGHGKNYDPQWFRFKKEVDVPQEVPEEGSEKEVEDLNKESEKWWDLSSGDQIKTEEVPERFK